MSDKKKELSPLKQLGDKIEDHDNKLVNWIREGKTLQMMNVLTAQQEINLIVQDALNNKSSSGGRKRNRKKRTKRRTRGKKRGRSKRKSRRRKKSRKRRRK